MENNKNNNPEMDLGLQISERVANGTYSNLVIVTHSPTEFVLDFASILPGVNKANVVSRIIMAPEHTKRLLRALEDNLAKYENQFGEIELPEEKKVVMPMGFGPNNQNAS